MMSEKTDVDRLREDVDRKLGVLEHNMLELFKDWASILRGFKKDLEELKNNGKD